MRDMQSAREGQDKPLVGVLPRGPGRGGADRIVGEDYREGAILEIF